MGPTFFQNTDPDKYNQNIYGSEPPYLRLSPTRPISPAESCTCQPAARRNFLGGQIFFWQLSAVWATAEKTAGFGILRVFHRPSVAARFLLPTPPPKSSQSSSYQLLKYV